MNEAPRHIVLRDMFNHLAHHRGQLTVYLRLNDQTVPAIVSGAFGSAPISSSVRMNASGL